MSYCVNCGVELHKTAERCPLCQTEVLNPRQAVDTHSPRPYPTHRVEVEAPSQAALAVLLSLMLACAVAACAILNIFVYTERAWWLYVLGAAVVLWVVLVPRLVWEFSPPLHILLDCAVGAVYLYLISYETGAEWFWGLLLPITILIALVLEGLAYMLRGGRRSTISSIALFIGAAGIILAGIDLLAVHYLHQEFYLTWSVITTVICVGLIVPLGIVRHHPAMREEVRKRFRM